MNIRVAPRTEIKGAMNQDESLSKAIWKPSANKEMLQYRAQLLAQVRDFFSRQGVMEVDTPVLATTSVTDINIESITARVNQSECYLQTSPEYFMKRLLAAGVGDIYCMGKVFRDGEIGPRHNPEFTLLEWYRLDWDEHQLMAEVSALIKYLYISLNQVEPEVSHFSYAECFSKVFHVDPHSCPLEVLHALAVDIGAENWGKETRSNCLDLLFSQRVEPSLPNGLVFIYDYPVCQAALSEIRHTGTGELVCRRFEAFLNGVELANGYYELTAAEELRERFEADNRSRSSMGQKHMPLDRFLASAMESGLPSCSGVAVGIDRLLMSVYAVDSIEQVIPFNWQRC